MATWVSDHNVGIVIEPEKEKLISAFFSIENNILDINRDCSFREELKGALNFNFFVSSLKKLCFSKMNIFVTGASGFVGKTTCTRYIGA